MRGNVECDEDKHLKIADLLGEDNIREISFTGNDIVVEHVELDTTSFCKCLW